MAAGATTDGEFPFADVATSETVYAVPFSRPTMLHVVSANAVFVGFVEQV